jgi:Xaa-Pro aminopeptidase
LLDSFARASLWQVGLDYRHGTGHGVGHVLNVHELPIIGTRKYTDIGVCENMIITIEPGFYEDQNFGIRIENCELVVEANTKFKNFNAKPFLTFEPLTYVPIQRELIDKSLLDASEIEWINSYHKKCLDLTGARLKEQNKTDVYNWLIENTKEL